MDARVEDIKVETRGVLSTSFLADSAVWFVVTTGFLSTGLIKIFPMLSISP
jgi:hypothetical protein